MSKRDSDIAALKQAVAAANARNEQTMKIHFRTFETVTEIASLTTTEQLDAFNAMDHRLEGHPRRVTVKVSDVAAAIASL